jgi:hypothetical protein
MSSLQRCPFVVFRNIHGGGGRVSTRNTPAAVSQRSGGKHVESRDDTERVWRGRGNIGRPCRDCRRRIGLEVKPWFAIEGSGTWLDWGQGVRAFAPSVTGQVALLTPRPFVPFLTGGAGLYHASFNRIDTAMPGFYRRRMMGMANLGSTITFNDPSLVGGGGLTVFVSRHWTVRPEILATVVLRDSRNFVVTTGAVRFAYHFEDHPVTP